MAHGTQRPVSIEELLAYLLRVLSGASRMLIISLVEKLFFYSE